MEKKKIMARKKFLQYFPKGFRDQKFYAWERGYKWQAHLAWEESLSEKKFKSLLFDSNYEEIAQTAIRIETKTNLLFSFEKMAIRDAVKSKDGAKAFSEGLFAYIHGSDHKEKRFKNFANVLDQLPRKQTRVKTWPLQTVFGFIANPREHIFLKPRVTQLAAKKYMFDFKYNSNPNWETYQSLFELADLVGNDVADLKPIDYIDLQSFIWILGSEEYPD